MACSSFVPINPAMMESRKIRPHEPSFSPSDAIPIPPPSFREAIIAAAGNLECPATKKRKAITSKPHNGLRKLKEQHPYDALSTEAVHTSNTVRSELKSCGQRKTDQGYKQSPSQVSLTDLPKETISRFGTFRFQPPRVSVVEDPCKEGITIYKATLLDENISAESVVPAQAKSCKLDSQKKVRSAESQETMEVTLPLDFDHFGHPAQSEEERILYDTCKSLSPSPLAVDEYDQDFLEDAFRAVEDNISSHVPGGTDHLDFSLPQDAQPKVQATDSDFGSDPFAPDDAEHQDQDHIRPSSPINSCGIASSQLAQVDFLSPQADFGSMLPPSYQTPRKSSSPKNTPESLPDPLPNTADSGPVHKHASPKGPSTTPFLRPNFPRPVAARSSVSNLTSETRILTCFRTAEYLRAISSSSPTSGLLIELYALVISSTRVGRAQHFTFADLFFPQRPPHLHGTCTIWQGSELYEDDTRPFLGTTREHGRLCRAMVRPKRLTGPYSVSLGSSPLVKRYATEGGSPGRENGNGNGETGRTSALGSQVEVLNIWEAAWDDVEYVRGIVCA